MALPPALKENPQFGVGQFGANAAFDGLLGLRYAWGTTFGLVLPNIDKALEQLNKGGGLGGGSVFGPGFNLFSSASLKMLEEIGHGLTHTQAAAAEKYVTEAWAFEGIGAVIERLAEDVVHTRKLIANKTAPLPIQRVVKPNVRRQLAPVARRAEQAERRAEAAEKRARALEARVALLERKTLRPNAGVIVGLPPRVGVGEREIERIKAGLRAVWGRRNLAAFIALLLAALAKIGASWIRCRNVSRYGRALCGMDRTLLDALLAGSLIIVSAVSLKEFARMMIVVTEETKGQVFHGFKETREIFG